MTGSVIGKQKIRWVSLSNPACVGKRKLMKNRKPNRWAEWNYSNEGYYFVTICTKNRNPIFGKMVISNRDDVSENVSVWSGIPTVGAGLRPAPTVII